ncbi:MAG TPA: beta-propeller domain-containing protein [Nitrososphaerales archaeon]|nr:beta-propeller domain-containing protein [Nitrososphaerales archaeon]
MQPTERRGVGREELAWAGFLILIVAGAAFLWFPRSSTSNPSASTTAGNAAPGTLSSFQTYQELNQFITANAKSAQQYGGPGGVFFGGALVPGMTTTVQGAMSTTTTVAAAAVGSTSSGYTTTNNQVQGVDELDMVKTDGAYLYVASSQTVSIIKALPANSTAIVSTISLPTSDILGISIAPQRLAVIAQSNVDASVDIRLYDVSNLSAPSLVKSVSVNGSQVAARFAQGYLYDIVQQPSFVDNGSGNVTALYPGSATDGASSALPPESTYYTPNKSQVSVYTMIVSMSMSTGAQSSVAVLTGQSSTVYVSTSNIYVVYPNFPSYYADGIQGDVFGGSAGPVAVGGAHQPQNSTVVRVAYSDGVLGADSAGSFPGVVLNQFSMDEYNGYFRVAASRAVSMNGTSSRSDDVYVLDQNFTQVGALRNIAPGENIYSVLFSGEVGYVVTFEQVDPLFAISFKNPASPVILSALTVSGFSDYLYPFGSSYLIGVGKDTVASSSGNFAYYLGMKLSLFHVAGDGTSTEVANYMIGDRGTDSPVLSDHLAFTFDPARNISVIPVDLAKVSGNQTSPPGSPPPYGQQVWQGAYVISVSPTGFDLLGTVTQYPQGSGGSYFGSSGGHDIYRSVIIGNALYTISQDEVMVSDLTSFSTLATVTLG